MAWLSMFQMLPKPSGCGAVVYALATWILERGFVRWAWEGASSIISCTQLGSHTQSPCFLGVLGQYPLCSALGAPVLVVGAGQSTRLSRCLSRDPAARNLTLYLLLGTILGAEGEAQRGAVRKVGCSKPCLRRTQVWRMNYGRLFKLCV